jgi:uncharacterized protein YprB with RNaseH-like and TPR domain
MRYAIDIETVGLPDAKEFAEPIAAPSNYKDPAKIAEYIAKAEADQITKAGLDLDLCRVVAIGLQYERDATPTILMAKDEADEPAMLDELWAVLLKDKHPVLVGFNHIGFDLPVLIRRCQYLGVSYPHLVLDKFRTPHIDLMHKLTWNGLVRARSLKFYARRFGIRFDDAVSGADIGSLVAAGEWDKVQAHVASDVALTMALGRKLGVLEPEPTPHPELVF